MRGSQAVWWAIENGLTAEAASRSCASCTSSIPSSCRRRGWSAVLDRLERAVSSTPTTGGFQKALGIEVKVARGPHVILLHQHSDAEADERIALLEQVIAGYLLALRRRRGSSCLSRGTGWYRPGSPTRKTTWLSCTPRDADGVRHDARLLSPDLERRGRLRRPQHATSSERRRKKLADRSATNCGDSPKRSNELPLAAGFEIKLGGRAGADRRPRRGEGGDRADSRVRSRVRRCSWIWIGGRSTWARRPTR